MKTCDHCGGAIMPNDKPYAFAGKFCTCAFPLNMRRALELSTTIVPDKLKAENTRLLRQLAEAVKALTEIGVDGFHIEYTKGKCKHGKYDFDSCDECYEDHANSALKLIRDIGEGTV
jgi:hypothetical protein